ncbi:unnamed protein product [Rotaria magnacalcarata]|uniref:Uncharacterized protein n=1 Tax=Rotaria magnacalcarata TaxID=392030 RepID=A0A816Q1K9_9BILA|nr:unnamed protein product [Rotaria magnacalcarata]
MAKGKKKSKKKDAALIELNVQLLKRLLKLYDQYSTEQSSIPSVEVTKTIRALLEEGDSLSKVFLRPNPSKIVKPVEGADQIGLTTEPPPIIQTYVRPFIRALLTCQLSALKEFSVWNICMDLLDCLELGNYIKLQTTVLQTVSLYDCLLQPDPLYRLSASFNICRTLRIVNLDFNEFGDEGCLLLCNNLAGNQCITRLSLTYCDLGPICGAPLGRLLVETALAEIYLDGNHFGCEGAYDLIKLLLIDCEKYNIDKEEKLRADMEAKIQEAALRVQQGLPAELTPAEKKERKKKKKKKKKLSLDDMPPCGPFVTKIHLFDNEIDCLQADGFAVVQKAVNAFARLIEISEELEELDLDENVIGHVCGGIILEALKSRKERKAKKIKINVSEKIDQFVFADILKLSAKMKKKRKRGKKKK